MKRWVILLLLPSLATAAFAVAGRADRAYGQVAAAKPSASPSPSPSRTSPSPSPSPSPPPPKPPALSPAAHEFATICVRDTSADFVFTLTNQAKDELTVTGVTAGVPFLAGPSSAIKVPPGGSASVPVRYRPTERGSHSGAVTVDTDHGPASANVSGSAIDKQLSVAPSILSFGPVRTRTTSGPRAITIANTGGDTVRVASLTLGGSAAANFSAVGLGPVTLAPGAAKRVTVTFTPSSDGPKSAALAMTSDACGLAARTVTLSGTGAKPGITVRPERLTLSAVPGTAGSPQTVTVTDSGDAPLKVSSVTLTGPDATSFVLRGVPRLPVTVAPGDTFAFDVRFVAGSIEDPPPSALIEIASDDASRRVVKVALLAAYASPSPSPSPSISASPTASAAPPASPKRGGGFRINLKALGEYASVLLVVVVVGATFATLLGFRRFKFRRIIRRYTT